jgi:hypothetical protein
MTILLILLSIVIFGLLISEAITSSAIRKNFIKYLLSIGDEKTVRWLNLLYRPIFEVELMMEKKYEETKDEEYLLFSEEYREFVLKGRLLACLLFGLLVIYVIFTN